MRGIRINFTPEAGGPSFDFSEPLRNFEATVQNALVNLGTALGSDPYFETRGTDLLADAVAGRMINRTWANHSANFAALNTLVFAQSVDESDDIHRLANFQLKATRLDGQTVQVFAQATSADGQVTGIIAEL